MNYHYLELDKILFNIHSNIIVFLRHNHVENMGTITQMSKHNSKYTAL